jgi:hypothetical protein
MARFPSEVEPAILLDTAIAIGDLSRAMLTTVDGVSRGAQPETQKKFAAAPDGAEKTKLAQKIGDQNKIYEVLLVAEDSMAFVSAAVQKDVSGALAKLQKVMSDPFVARNLDTRFARAATFVLMLAQAKDRAEAQKVIQEAAAPMGTYRAKYAADTVMINGYVGVFGVARIGTVTENTNPNYPGLGSPFVQPLSAPVGVEWSYANCIGGAHHCGFGIVAFDPLALRILYNGSGAIEADFDGVLQPGVLLHMGFFRSPFDLMAGATIQPLLKSSARNCGAIGEDKACWQAPINLQLGLSVDAPLLQLK